MKNGLVVDEYENKFWYKDNKYHREDGPAYECVNGTKEWYLNGQLHRIDGPAIEWAGGDKVWYYQGKYVRCQSQEEFERIINLLAFG